MICDYQLIQILNLSSSFICYKPVHFLVFLTLKLFCYNFLIQYFYGVQINRINFDKKGIKSVTRFKFNF